MTIKVGDKVKTHGYYEGIEGIITRIVPGEDVKIMGRLKSVLLNLVLKNLIGLKSDLWNILFILIGEKLSLFFPLDTPLLSCHTEKNHGPVI